MFYPFEVSNPHIIYALLGGFIVLFGMFSLFLRERLYVGEAIWAFIFGIIIGPYCANVFDPRSWGGDDDTNVITLEFTRIVLAIGVFAIGVELPKAYMWKHARSLLFLLVPVMTWGWFVSAGLIYALIPGLNFLSSLAVAACLTPTDPILAAAVVGGKWADKHVPAHIRHLLAAESGCNDGAAFPFLFIALYLIIDKTTGAAVRDWFLLLWLYQVILGAIIGSMLGFGFRHLMKFCQRHDLIDRHSYVAQYVSLAILTIGVCTLLGSDDLLAAFFCGTAFAWDGFFNRQTEESVFSSVIDTLFNVAAFIFVGAWMPFKDFQNAELTLSVWRLIVIAILVLLLRRLPVMIMTYKWIPDIKTFREALFTGHFGPIGIGAVFISTLAVQILDHAHLEDNHQAELLMETIQPIVAFMVLCSITIHGLSIPSFSLGRRVHSVSRTWSRRETLTSGQPDWTNHARMVTRGEDIVINRDRDPSDLEKGEGSPSSSERKISPQHTPSEHTLENVLMADSNITDETRVAQQESSLRTHAAAPPSTRTDSGRDYREQTPPDGTERIAEWIEGSHRVLETRAGPGSDVEVTVIDNDYPEPSTRPTHTWSGKMHELENNAEEIGRNISKELSRISSRARHPLSPVLGDKQKPADVEAQIQPGNAGVVAEDDDDEGWASEGSSGGNPNTSTLITGASESRKRSTSRVGKTAHVVGAARGRWRPSFRRNSINATAGAGSSLDEVRGRESRRVDPAVTFAPESPGPSGTGRATDLALKNNRIDSIRAQHSRPQTRENSPSRSVRFLDEGRRSNTGESLQVPSTPGDRRSPSPAR